MNETESTDDAFDGDERLATAFEAVFPDRAVEAVHRTGPSWNDQNRTVAVDLAGGNRVFLKVAADGDGSRIAREVAAIDYVGANCEVRVPNVVASDPDGDVPYLVTEPIDGRTVFRDWSDWSLDERADAVRRIGAALADLHSRRFERHGHVVGGGADGLDLETGSWTTVLVDRIEIYRELATSDRFDGHFDRVIEAVEANRDLLDRAPAVLVHGDPARANTFHGADGIGFVDWEIAHVGDPARELHRARRQAVESGDPDGVDRLATALHEGYRDRAGSLPDGFEERTPVYDAVGHLGKSGFFDKHLEFSDESAAELAERIEREMDRRLAAIR